MIDTPHAMTYDEAHAYMASMLTFGIRIGLERILVLLEELDHPERGVDVFHVAGTNGKGSTCAYVAHILAAAGRRVGWFTSPYLVRFTERMRILDGEAGLQGYAADDAYGEISRDAFAEVMTMVKAAVDRMVDHGHEPPTEFELITAAAFVFFKNEGADAIVLETGLGGRLDSTNVIDRPVATIITAIGHDHMVRLGDTIEAITREKAGIIKRHTPLIAYRPEDALADPDEALACRRVLTDTAARLDAPLTFIGRDGVKTKTASGHGQTFVYDETTYETRLLADYQPLHAALAIAATTGFVPAEAQRRGVAATRWPGRLECLRRDPLVLVDGAHNREGAIGLKRQLDRLFGRAPLVMMVGILADKDVTGMLQAVLGDGRDEALIICTTPDSHRALDPHLLAQRSTAIGGSAYTVVVESDPQAAARRALAEAKRRHWPLVAWGSLYLIGAVRATLKTHQGETNEDT